ncbi:Putative S-adenosyl-L-methionine-dependent methyltransferase, Methyltransferase domain 25 [Septoria linicola]|uniref:S-adenosyl-L-methionine-dependent methyltransferase, Methyltransferase domain 25 n=1 Tax=Septoria linicola TaxID=215465 RepID=A0A9Q9ALU9_9PEZI|nr:putative S-adenosyl-L-methionine-dependent methyltransferase, Methyltransferase domain 25 [Septoria linicola]USW48493.1 Putative S-adenosyl-L-methionine-dependent methyltransferase, Methyltransferase domain 25 [Septoria linicola]
MLQHEASDAGHRGETCRTDARKNPRAMRAPERIQTALRSFRVLRDLSPSQMQNFMDSYLIYSLDWADEETMVTTLGPDYERVVGQKLADYYCVLNHLCALGELEKMYIPPAMDLDENIMTNQLLYEQQVCKELLLPPNARVLELGCGRGRVAAHVSRVTSAQIVGLNIDEDQVISARNYNEHSGLRNRFIRADFNDLPLPVESESFDGFYQIQAFSLAKDHDALCQELYRVLKPGARLSLLDWVSLEAYNPQDPHHQELMTAIKPLIGAVGTPTPASLASSLTKAGFQMIDSSNMSIDGLQAPLIERADGFFRTVRKVVLGGVRLGVLPAHFKTLFNRLTQDCDAFVEADRKRLITTSWHWLAEKPLSKAGKKGSDDSAYGSLSSSQEAIDNSRTSLSHGNGNAESNANTGGAHDSTAAN